MYGRRKQLLCELRRCQTLQEKGRLDTLWVIMFSISQPVLRFYLSDFRLCTNWLSSWRQQKAMRYCACANNSGGAAAAKINGSAHCSLRRPSISMRLLSLTFSFPTLLQHFITEMLSYTWRLLNELYVSLQLEIMMSS